jgi:hypothetical protein
MAGDLRHAKSGAVIAKPDISSHFLADLVQGFPHEPEIFLGGVGSSEALRGGSVGDIVQQALGGGPDDRDDIRAPVLRRPGLD